MSYRRIQYLAPALLFLTSLPSFADVTLNNGADINMNSSAGSTIIFSDGSILSTVTGQGADGADGATGPKGQLAPMRLYRPDTAEQTTPYPYQDSSAADRTMQRKLNTPLSRVGTLV